jgi:probable aminopeptidase NPEPL1
MELEFGKSATALRTAAHCLLVANKAAFGPRQRLAPALRKWLGERADAALALGDEAAPGLLGATATTRIDGKHRLTVGALAEQVSRHADPARAEGVRKCVAAAGFAADQQNAVLLVLDDESHLLAAVNAVGKALPTFSRKSAQKRGGTVTVLACRRDGTPVAIDAATQQIVGQARQAAALVDMPPTELDPAAFAAAARQVLRGCPGVKVSELVGDALAKRGLGGIHAVGRCATSAPRLLVAQFAGKRVGKAVPHVALVGKGVTYDTGGLHIKARGAMETMKADMGGAAAVLGAFVALCQQRPAGKLSLLLCLAENAIGPAAYKPDDILTLHSGKTVEINNTDAEGRLLLADGCSYAARVLGATIVLDAATLTGAQGVATGDVHAAVVCNDDAVEQALLAAGRQTGDLCWPLPFAPEFYRSEFASPIADMRNSVKNRSNAQVSCAAEFVHWHIDGTGVRWGHVDLASPAFRGNRGTGYGVALLAAAVQLLQR